MNCVRMCLNYYYDYFGNILHDDKLKRTYVRCHLYNRFFFGDCSMANGVKNDVYIRIALFLCVTTCFIVTRHVRTYVPWSMV